MLDTTHTSEPSNAIEFRPIARGAWSLVARQRVDIARNELFPFFADAANLARLTPPEVGFRILTPLPIAMAAGALIDYEIRLRGLPMQWRTEITAWNPPIEFSDVQLRGPYAEWIHEHRFIELSPRSTLVEDHVTYRLPLGWLGAMAGPLVRHQLRRIFTFRREVIARLTPGTMHNRVVQGSTPGL